MSKKAAKKSVAETIAASVTLSKTNKILVAMEKVRGRHQTASVLKNALLDSQRTREIARRTVGRKDTPAEE